MVTGAPAPAAHAEQRERQQRHGDHQEDDGQRHQQDGQRDLVGRLLALGAFDHRDHAVEEGLARVGGDAHHDPVRQHAGAAGDRGEVAARLADHRRRFAGDGAFVDRGHAFDHLAVGRDHVAGLDQHHVALAQRRRRQPAPCLGGWLGGHALLQAAQRGRLRLAAALGQRFGEVGEQHGEPQPHGDGGDEAERRLALPPSACAASKVVMMLPT
jgi:hypothetical protein